MRYGSSTAPSSAHPTYNAACRWCVTIINTKSTHLPKAIPLLVASEDLAVSKQHTDVDRSDQPPTHPQSTVRGKWLSGCH